jgi:hypothetical protein
MTTFKNKTEQVFQDGDLMILPGASFSTEEDSRVEQLRGQYAWQFDEVSGKGAKDAPTEADVKAQQLPGAVRELRNGDHVTLDATGTQDTKVGQ